MSSAHYDADVKSPRLTSGARGTAMGRPATFAIGNRLSMIAICWIAISLATSTHADPLAQVFFVDGNVTTLDQGSGSRRLARGDEIPLTAKLHADRGSEAIIGFGDLTIRGFGESE